MKIERVFGTNMDLTDAIEQYVRKRVDALAKFTKRVQPASISVEVGRPSDHHKSGDVYYAEFHADVNGEKFYASSHSDNLYAAIDSVQTDLKRQLTEWRKRQASLNKREGRSFKKFLRFGR